jgi:hypothetical protein
MTNSMSLGYSVFGNVVRASKRAVSVKLLVVDFANFYTCPFRDSKQLNSSFICHPLISICCM